MSSSRDGKARRGRARAWGACSRQGQQQQAGAKHAVGAPTATVSGVCAGSHMQVANTRESVCSVSQRTANPEA